MSNIFELENISDFSEKINMDELYEKKRSHDLNTLELFNKILHRIHVKIKMVSRQKNNDQVCWFIVPERILGVPKYDNAACIAYLIDKLQTNGFKVKYTNPNLLLIAWNHYVPSYVRNEIKKKTGISVDEYGNKINDDDDNCEYQLEDGTEYNKHLLHSQQNNEKVNKKEYASIKSYKPSGKLMYDDDILSKIEHRFG